VAGERGQGGEGVVDLDDGDVLVGGRGPPALQQHRRGAAGERRRDELVAVARGDDRHEQGAGRRRAAVEEGAADLPRTTTQETTAGGRGQALGGPVHGSTVITPARLYARKRRRAGRGVRAGAPPLRRRAAGVTLRNAGTGGGA